MIHYLIFFFILLLLEIFYISAAKRLRIVDAPNQRSSHADSVAIGGGLIFFFALLIWWIWSGCYDWIAMVGFTLLAIISFIDDLHDVKISFRLILQFISGALILTQIQPHCSACLWIFALVMGIGLINAFNFMDGINGLIGLYSLIFFTGCLYIDYYIVPGFVDQRLLILMSMACIVFCLFNFRVKALCFSGDVGSIVVGAVVFYVLARLVFRTGNIGWLLLVAVYGTDVTLTLLRRMFNRQNIFQAHRTHAYQLASNELGISQLGVASSLCFIQVLIDIPALFFGLNAWWYFLVVCVLLAAGYLITVKKALK